MATTSRDRQSGLWQRDPDTGYFTKAPSSSSANAGDGQGGPFKYYEPPARSSTTNRRSFAERANELPYSNGGDTYAGAAADASGKYNITSVLRDPNHINMVRTLHDVGGDTNANDLARGQHVNELDSPVTQDSGPEIDGLVHGGPETFTTAQHLKDVPAATGTGNMRQVPLRTIDTNVGAPDNVRTKAWSPEDPTSPQRLVDSKQINGTSKHSRQSSVPDRSPLQRLERGASKEEKRARMEEAEHRAVQRQSTLRSEKGRAVSDGSNGRPSESTSDKYYQNSPRQVSTGGVARDTNGSERTRYPSNTSRGVAPAVAQEPRPYSYAPEMPRSTGSTRQRDVDRSYAIPTYERDLRTPPIAKVAQPYHHAPEVPRSTDAFRLRDRVGVSREAPRDSEGDPATANEGRPYSYDAEAPRRGQGQRMSGDYSQGRNVSDAQYSGGSVSRSASGQYKHRLRDAGYAGAAAAATVGAGSMAYEAAASDPSKRMYEPRDGDHGDSVSRAGSKRLQKRNGPTQARGSTDGGPPQNMSGPSGASPQASEDQSGVGMKQQLGTNRMGDGLYGSTHDREAAERHTEPDPISRRDAATDEGHEVPYEIPPQTAAGQNAKAQVGFHRVGTRENEHGDHHHKFAGMLHRHNDHAGPRGYHADKSVPDWLGAAPAVLAVGDLEFKQAAANGQGEDAWWEKDRRSSSSARQTQPISQYDGPFEEEAKLFQPPMYLKCGPLLRYTGMRQEGERSVWRGSVMIVTEDEQSDYSTAPTLRLFAQPMNLLTPLPRHVIDSGQQLPPEYEDPVAGQVKVSRTGRPLYVRPVHDLAGEADLSREENNQGLYAATRTPILGPLTSHGPDGRQSQHISFQDKGRVQGQDGEKAGRYKDVRAIRLHTERGLTFWRWSIEVELGSQQHRVAYRINKGPALGFWVPARNESMNMMFHSCNGFSMGIDTDTFCGPDPLWRDVMNKHQSRPFHVMIGGGDQIYNDAVMRDTTLFKEWLQTKSPDWKHEADFSVEMQNELEEFYLNRYSMWFSQGLFAMANSQIPMVNMWDDHDIIDGFGSYPHHFMASKVFCGLGAIAFKYYMLFQHQSLNVETAKEEPSWVLGASPGPYINELSRHLLLDMGQHVKLLAIDCRTERQRDLIVSEQTYDILFNKCQAEIRNGQTKHLLVLLGVPIAYPRLNFLENILTSRMMDPIKAIGRTGMLGGFVNKFDGGVEILDDLDDHWTAKYHKAERNWFIQELQELAAEKSVRITILGGDVHLGAVGQFYTPKKFGVAKDRDHRYIPNVISSAIVNTPPPTMMADVLNKRNKVHHLDHETDEDLIPMFDVDVDGSKRNNKCLLPRRNYCTIREFQPGHTPPPSPPPERNVQFANDVEEIQDDRRYPPGSMARRTMSFTGGLVRRLSGSRSRESSTGQNSPAMARSSSMDNTRPMDNSAQPPRRPSFHRRPTDLNEKALRKAAAKGGAPDEEADAEREPGHINLEGGLDITLNVEIDQHDPVGGTQAYRLLVPALWYTGGQDHNTAHLKGRTGGLLNRLRSKRGKKSEEYSRSPSPDANANAAYSSAYSGGQNGNNVQQQQRSQYYGNDGTYSGDQSSAPQGLVVDQRATAYGKGYNNQPPPIGFAHQSDTPPPQQQQGVHNTYSNGQGYRSTSMPNPQSQYQQGPYDREQDEYTEGSVTSGEYVDARDRQPGRFNKVERFFGMGSREQGYAGNGVYGNSDAAPAKRRPSWKVWK